MRLASLALLSAVAATSGAQQPTSQPLNALEPLAPVDSSAPRPLQVGLTVGTRGLGLEVARLVAPRLALRVGASGAGGTVRDIDVGSLTTTGSVRLVSAHALVDLYPFRRAGLHLTGGVMSGTSSVALDAQPQAGQFELNGVTYQSNQVGTLRGRVTLPHAMPYAGIGLGRPSAYGVRFVPFTDVGVAFGRATTELRAENAPNNAQLAANVEAERRNVDDDLRKLPFYPVVTMTLAWRF